MARSAGGAATFHAPFSPQAGPEGSAASAGASARAPENAPDAPWTRAFEAISDPMLVVDDALRVRAANRAARNAAPPVPEGAPCHLLCSPDLGHPPEGCPLAGARLPRRAVGREVRGLFGDRRRVHHVSTFPLEPGSEPAGFVQVYRDVTAERELQSQVLRSQQLSTVGKLAAGVAHEIRNPLAAMTNAVSLLRNAPGLDGEDRELVEIVLEEARRLDRIVSDFLGFARPGPLRFEQTELGELVGATARLAARDDAPEIQVAIADGLPAVSCDPDGVRQVVWNLLRNAAEAAGPGGHVRVQVEPRAHGGRPGVAVDVRDDGPGVHAEIRERAFEPFATSKPNGSGLGLALARQIATQHGGAIELANAPEGGARAWLWLPVERRSG